MPSPDHAAASSQRRTGAQCEPPRDGLRDVLDLRRVARRGI